jgi:hypothetical protein
MVPLKPRPASADGASVARATLASAWLGIESLGLGSVEGFGGTLLCARRQPLDADGSLGYHEEFFAFDQLLGAVTVAAHECLDLGIGQAVSCPLGYVDGQLRRAKLLGNTGFGTCHFFSFCGTEYGLGCRAGARRTARIVLQNGCCHT